jgi:hypothetical protein
MHLIYFDESKHDPSNSPYFFFGGILISQSDAIQVEKTLAQIQYNFFGKHSLDQSTELHGVDMFNGKGNFKGRALSERLTLFEHVLTCLKDNKVASRFIKLDVPSHRSKYKYPEPEYRLSLMLFLERCCEYLDLVDDLGIAHGDYEQDEISRSVLDFSQFKAQGKTRYHGRPLGRLLDTVHFSHSHYSRFLQAADVVCYLCQRYESGKVRTAHHDQILNAHWNHFKGGANFSLQCWP